MNLEDKFDKIVRKKVEEAEFPFDESHWQNASKLIDADRAVSAGRGGKLFLLFGILTIVLGTSGFLGYKYLSSDNNGNVTQHTNNSQTGLNGNAENIAKAGDFNGSEVNVNGNTNVAQENISQNSLNNGANNTSSNAANYSSENNNTSNVVNEVSTGRASITSNPVKLNTPSVNSNNNPNKIAAQGKPDNSNNEDLVNAGNKDAGKPGTKINKNGANGRDGLAENTESDGLTNHPNSDAYRTYNLSDLLQEMPSKQLKLPVHLDSVMRKTPYDFIRVYDNDYFKRREKRKSNYLNIEVGTTYLMGWFTLNGTDGRGFNGFAGTNYGFYMGRQSSISIGAQIYNISNIKQPFYTASKLNYGFGATGTYTSITATNLLYFAVPLKYNFHINKLNQVGVGVNAGFLFTGNNTVETYRVQDNVKEGISKKTQKGNFEGVNTENLVVSAFFSHAFNRRFKLNGELLYGISDLYRDTPVSTTKERTIGAKLSLQYNIFEK